VVLAAFLCEARSTARGSVETHERTAPHVVTCYVFGP